ncbi:MAG: MATE family efflux transporter [Sphingomonas sp. 28-62-20]|nr:MAG: MATE family efflux transporter [Sphingomonas sp. 28-62-20]
MIGQVTVPLVGVADTVVIGRTGDAAALAGVALGTTIVTFLFWSFGFLRMGMTGLTAQAQGARDRAEVEALLARGLMIGGAAGLALLALQALVIPLALLLFAGSDALDAQARAFMAMRLWGAPASLALYAISGWLLGLGRTRSALAVQLILNLVNIALDVWLVWGWHLGAAGVGLGTACAEWIALAAGLVIVVRVAGPGVIARLRDGWPRIVGRAALRRLVAVNADIMIRTIALLLLFGWFTNAGARLGATQLAANQLLMQFVAVAAFVLDGFCFTTEARVGQAIGAGDAATMRRAIRLTGEFALLSGIGFALITLLAGPALIDAMTPNPAIRSAAIAFLAYAALVPVIGMPAWLLDGVFIGATAGRALRNAGVLATIAYIATDLVLRRWGASGAWAALLAGYGWRAAALGVYLPGLFARVGAPLAPGARAT